MSEQTPPSGSNHDILAAILDEQREQTRLLKRINSIVQLWGVLLVLGILGTCLYLLFGVSLY